jgi:hypothetical protein
MWVRKFESGADQKDDATVSATIEPATGHSLEELLAALKDCHGSVRLTGENCLSFDGALADLERVEPIALIHVMPYQRLSEKYL